MDTFKLFRSGREELATRMGITETRKAAELLILRAAIQREDDVMRVVKLEPIDGGRFRYLIETPFQTYPKFVIGTTDAAFEDVRILLKFGAEDSALDSWEKGGGK